jgi:hypothetical protein
MKGNGLRKMNKISAFLATVLLVSACSNQAPTPYVEIEALPTLSIGYQVVESTKSSFMVVVNPEDNTNREGLLSIGVRLCEGAIKCKVWFWDDITKADTSFPLDPDKEATMIAVYTSDLYTSTDDLRVFTLGDAR